MDTQVMDFQWEMIFAVLAVGSALGGIMLRQGAFLRKEIVELRQRMESDNAELRSDNAVLRDKMESDHTALRTKIESDHTALRAKMESDLAALRGEIIALRERFVRVEVTLEMIRTGFWPQRNTEDEISKKQSA